MAEVVLIDTCVLLNVLDVPAFNQDRAKILDDLGRLMKNSSVSLLLPFAAIIETGNHIAHLRDGQVRRRFATEFVRQVQQAIDGNAPWTPTQGVETGKLASWLGEFPDHAMRSIGLGDLSIIKEFDAACVRHPNHRVRIWSLDGHLMGHDRPARAI